MDFVQSAKSVFALLRENMLKHILRKSLKESVFTPNAIQTVETYPVGNGWRKILTRFADTNKKHIGIIQRSFVLKREMRMQICRQNKNVSLFLEEWNQVGIGEHSFQKSTINIMLITTIAIKPNLICDLNTGDLHTLMQ